MPFRPAGCALARPLAGACDDYTIGIGTANILGRLLFGVGAFTGARAGGTQTMIEPSKSAPVKVQAADPVAHLLPIERALEHMRHERRKLPRSCP